MFKQWLGRWFGRSPAGARSSAPASDDPIEYKAYRIAPAPIAEGQVWRVAGEISLEVDGIRKTHRFIRADTLPDRDSAVQTMILKARLLIDQQGDRLFQQGPPG